MVKIQIDLSEMEDRIVEVHKIMNKLKTKEEAIKRMIQSFEVEVVRKGDAKRIPLSFGTLDVGKR